MTELYGTYLKYELNCSYNGGGVVYCKDENLDHKVDIYCNLVGPLDQS